MIQLDVTRAAKDLEKASPLTILEWASGYAGSLAVSSSFGADASVMLSLVARLTPKPTILFIDTGYHFPETIAYGSGLCDAFGLTYLNVTPKLTVAQHEKTNGTQYATDPDSCCHSRKVEPLDTVLGKFNGWVTGIRRGQTFQREETAVVSLEQRAGQDILKVAPLATWTTSDVNSYKKAMGLPEHPLWDKGYKSIGCEPCTTPVAAGEDPRNGRWSAFTGKTECGLHLPQGEKS